MPTARSPLTNAESLVARREAARCPQASVKSPAYAAISTASATRNTVARSAPADCSRANVSAARDASSHRNHNDRSIIAVSPNKPNEAGPNHDRADVAATTHTGKNAITRYDE